MANFTNIDYDKQRPKVTPPQIGLADLRESHGLTQAAVAAQVASRITADKFNAGSLSLIEGGHRGASAEVLAALEQVFKLKPGALTVDYEPSHSRRKGAAA